MTTNPRQNFPDRLSHPPPSLSPKKKPLSDTVFVTLREFRMGHSVEQIAAQRGLVAGTIYGHLEQAIQAGESVDINRLLPLDQHAQIAAAFAQTGFGNLTGAKEILGDLYDYGQLRVFRALHGEKGQ